MLAVTALARDFRALTRRRLVITGGPGMGKTTLAVQLLLQLLATCAADQAAADTAGHGEIVPVPVPLTVSGWNLATPPRPARVAGRRRHHPHPAHPAGRRRLPDPVPGRRPP
ncbi:hypothetical protein GCM10027187_63530 [Streptosporangium sandarakinum]